MFAINKMPLIEGLVVTIHPQAMMDSSVGSLLLLRMRRFGFFAYVVIFWVLGPRELASRVFTEFQ
ncbi:hypothetical protein LTR49_028491, partial [Elasticomyces elasticus]